MEITFQSQQLESDLKKALKLKEFRLFYQPKIELISGKIAGIEALIRWEHPIKGFISPLDFIPLAEKTGIILPIGEWVIRTACIQNKQWQEAGLPPMIMAVNLSASQFYQFNFVEMVQQILVETALSPEYLEFEITESMMMDVEMVLPIIKDLKRLGVRISLDDFGTGYSSLSYLKEFPIDIIKIDQSFVRNCTVDMKDATLVKAIIAMAHQLKLEVIAEGIETKDHLIFLQQNLCNGGQGYFFSKPLPSDKFVKEFYEVEKVVYQEGIPQEFGRQKWLEEELEISRQELKDMVRNQQGMIFKFNKQNGKFIHTLCDGELLYKIGLTPETLIGRELHDVLPKNEADRKLYYYQRAWEGEENVIYEGKLNGIWYLASLRPIRRGGQVVEVIASCVDITERKESEERYQKLVNSSPEPIVVHSKGIIKFINQAGVKIFGFTHYEEIIGKSILDFFHTDSRLDALKQLRRLNEESNKVELLEYKMIRKDDTIFFVEGTATRIVYNGEPAIQGIFRDITERKKAVEALRHSEEKYRLIAENTQDLIGVFDTNGVVQYASPSHENVLGFPPDRHEDNVVFNRVHPEDLPHIQKQYANMILSKTPCSVECRYKHANDDWVYVESVGTPVLNERNEVKYIVVVGRDISERKKAEELKRKSEKLAVVGQLALSVAHEIRNPLTTIKGFIQLLHKDVDSSLYTNTILSEVNRLEEIVSEFLILARPQISKLEKMDIKVLLKQAIEVFNKNIKISNVEIIEIYNFDKLYIYGDKIQIKHVFNHILQNAVEAMPNGGIIKIQLLRNDYNHIKIKFADNGCGISKKRLESIGEPFNSTKEKGTGLGLMVSQKVIQQHRGTIEIKSEINKGTTVDVLLPVENSIILK